MSYIRIIGFVLVAGFVAYAFLGNSASSGPDMRQVLARAEIALVNYDKYLKQNNIEKASEKNMDQLANYMQKTMNVEPRFYEESLIAMKLRKDAKFEGYKDSNSNGAVDSGEKRLFTIEVDTQNKRLIATNDDGRSIGRTISNIATGFFVGALIGNLMNRQRAAGITPGSFNNRKITPTSSYARSRAKSGGRFGGK